MPLASGFLALKTQLDLAANAGPAGSSTLTATQITTAISSILPMGLFVGFGIPFPPPPVGFTATQSLLNIAFNSSAAGNPDIMAIQMAQAIMALSPVVIPNGLPVLINQLKVIFNMGPAGEPSVVNALIAATIITYYTMGLVI